LLDLPEFPFPLLLLELPE
jgi:hypothetical protein